MLIENIRKADNSRIVIIAFIIFMLAGTAIAVTQQTDVSKGLSEPVIQFTGWRLSHFFLHLLLGFLFPSKFLLFFTLGVIWEIIEYIIGIVTENNWWGETLWAHCQDIIANTLGFMIGILITYYSS